MCFKIAFEPASANSHDKLITPFSYVTKSWDPKYMLADPSRSAFFVPTYVGTGTKGGSCYERGSWVVLGHRLLFGLLNEKILRLLFNLCSGCHFGHSDF